MLPPAAWPPVHAPSREVLIAIPVPAESRHDSAWALDLGADRYRISSIVANAHVTVGDVVRAAGGIDDVPEVTEVLQRGGGVSVFVLSDSSAAAAGDEAAIELSGHICDALRDAGAMAEECIPGVIGAVLAPGTLPSADDLTFIDAINDFFDSIFDDAVGRFAQPPNLSHLCPGSFMPLVMPEDGTGTFAEIDTRRAESIARRIAAMDPPERETGRAA